MYREIDISELLGIPYKHRGRDYTGFDCWGLVVCIYNRLGLQIRDLETYEEEGHKKGFNYFTPRDEWIKKSSPSPWDVALFLDNNGVAFHAGVVTPELKVIHAYKPLGVVIMPLSLLTRKLTLDGFYKQKAINGNGQI